MAVTTIELYGSRGFQEGQDPSIRYMYLVARSEEWEEVRAAVLAEAPLQVAGLYQQRLTGDPLGGGVWRVQLDYNYRSRFTSVNPTTQGQQPQSPQDQTGGSDPVPREVRVSSRGEKVHVLRSLLTAQKFKRSGDDRSINDHHGAIGVSKDRVEGTDIIAPSMAFTETWTFLEPYVSWGYLKLLRDLEGRVNMFKFRGFDAGEVMFLGYDSEPAEKGRRRIVYEFRTERNVIDVRIAGFDPVDENGNSIIVTKYGHEHLWLEYEKPANPAGDGTQMVPRAGYIEVVGPDESPDDDEPGQPVGGRLTVNRRNFAVMGIGA